MHGDISRELEAVGQSGQEALDLWRQMFNYERPHESLGMRCPGEALHLPRSANMKALQRIWIIPEMCPRRVTKDGLIKLDGEPLFLSTALAGWSVGLKPIASELMEVWFGRLFLGQVDLSASSFIRADIRLIKGEKWRLSTRIKLQMR